MYSFQTNSSSNLLGRALQLRYAALMVFCDPVPTEYTRLLHLLRSDWEDLLRWLDTSGLALYFLDRVEGCGLLQTLPLPVITRLRQNRADNAERMDAMMAESVAIQRRFQEARLSYAVLKGFSLWPVSVPRLELRSQLDHDFLVSEESAIEARKILEDVGYRLDIVNGRNWDFKADEGRTASLKDLYKAGGTRTAELHIEAVAAGRTSILLRTQNMYFHGIHMPVLSPIDLFLGQGLHLYGHVCSQFSRAAHLIEFRRHIIARHDDGFFWKKLEEHVAGNRAICIRLGVVILLITRVMGPFAPEALTRWTVDQLPASARLWVDMYGSRAVLATFPGSKLYLLLERELVSEGLPARRSLWQALVPRRLPGTIKSAVAGEALLARIERYCSLLSFYLIRLRFSSLEGIRYFRESILWRQYKNELP